MKYNIFLFLFIYPVVLFSQQKTETGNDSVLYYTQIFIDEINGYKVFGIDTLNDFIKIVLNKKRINVDSLQNYTDYPKVYVTNRNKKIYLKIIRGSDFGFGWYYTIGYTQNGVCSSCGPFIRKNDVSYFVINNNIKLGDNIKEVWSKANLVYFRSFEFNHIECFYFEKGIEYEIPYLPKYIYYYKFKNEKLVEIGFGHGMTGVNPMFY